MRTTLSTILRLCCGLTACLVAAALPAQAQLQYPPGNFDVTISFGCNCTCYCESNGAAVNNPIGAFLAANPVDHVSSTTKMPLANQLVPPHWTLFPPAPFTPPYAAADCYPFYLEGWTITHSAISANGHLNPDPKPVSGFNFQTPINFKVPFRYYEDLLTQAGIAPGEQPVPSLQATRPQPYPWDINTTLFLQNGQEYNMEQQLAVGYFPRECAPPALDTPVHYEETNALLRITLICDDGNLVNINNATITAVLDNVNIPPPLDETLGGVVTDPLFQNWAWPLTIGNAASSGTIPGSANTVQARLILAGPTTINNLGLLVRANRSYTLTIAYSVPVANSSPTYMAPITIDTGLVPACTNTDITIHTSFCYGHTNSPYSPCESTDLTGQLDMLGTMTLGSLVNIRAFNGPAGNSAADNLAAMPGAFHMQPVGSSAFVNAPNPIPDTPYSMQATMSLSSFSDYEYFQSPVLYPVEVPCDVVTDLGNMFVMCPGNPGIVQGTITLNGPVSSSPTYWSGVPALSVLQFATYDANGLPLDPPVNGNLPDPTLQNNNFNSQFLSYVKATGGASFGPPLLSVGGGSAVTEFENPVVFDGLTSLTAYSFVGNYSLRMAGLQGQQSVWSMNDLRLVFGSPVNLAYDIHETGAQFNDQVITCGTTETRNINHCFGLYTAQVINQYPDLETYNFVTITVSGTGPGYTVGPFTINQFPFTTQTALQNEADIPLFLPEGNYQYTATVYNGNGALVLGDITHFTVTCPTNPCLQVLCATNKTVPCTNNLPFDLPTVTSCCSNVVITPLSTVTSNAGSCPSYATRTWLITDSCGNSNLCSQTLTLVDTAPPVLTACVTNRITVGGVSDDFTGPEPASPSAALVARLAAAGTTNLRDFDDGCAHDRFFAHTFSNLPGCISEAHLTIRLRACGSVPNNDTLGLSFTGSGGTLVTNAGTWGRYLGSGNASPGLTNVAWSPGLTMVVPLDLSDLTNPDGTHTNLLPSLNANGFLDVIVQDDSAVDYVTLDVTSCCCGSNVTVRCDSAWGFATPTAVDECCTNVVVTRISAQTNGLCPQVITWVWQATDCCTNSTTCTQTVTVVDTTAPVITCVADKTVGCGTNWTFDVPNAYDTCCAEVTLQLISSNQIAGPCPAVWRGVWRATDCCTNSTTCTQIVTVVDITLPVISQCPTNRTIAAGTNCMAIIPDMRAQIMAIDNCGPITISQSPIGTQVGAGTYPVVFTVCDTCTNCVSCTNYVTVECRTNCCDGCTEPYPLSYTNIVYPGNNFLANNLCQGTNKTLADILPNVPEGTMLLVWNYSTQSYENPQIYDLGGWYDSTTGDPSTTTLEPGQGFVLQNQSGVPFTNVIQGCEPTCPLPCLPTNGCVLVGRFGVGAAEWTNLSSCPPICGTEVLIFNGASFDTYEYLGHHWSPQAPVLAIGQSAFVCLNTNTICCTNCCCEGCVTNSTGQYPASYQVVLQANVDYYLVDHLCHGTNNTLGAVLPNGPPGAVLQKYNGGVYTTYTFDPDDLTWYPDSNATLNPGEGFIFRSPMATTLTFEGCEPDCPPPCLPTNACVLVGRRGIGTATWTNLSSCPPVCGTRISRWNGTGFDNYDYANGNWSPQEPVLAIGESAWVCVLANTNCCTNCCTITCANDKTVECGSFWLFDPPTNSIGCCTNRAPTLVSSNLVSTTPCQKILEGVWQVVDCNNNITTCTQRVTVVDTTPPTITCVTDKSVACGTNWTFDTPTVADACCTNVNVQLVSSNLVSGPCPAVWQGVWRAADCCTNISTCTQTVTVVVTGPKVAPAILGVSKDAAGVHIRIQTLPCYGYALECKDSLSSLTWNVCQTMLGDGTMREFIDPPPLPPDARFYRVRLLCP
jgi:hypothetical protein